MALASHFFGEYPSKTLKNLEVLVLQLKLEKVDREILWFFLLFTKGYLIIQYLSCLKKRTFYQSNNSETETAGLEKTFFQQLKEQELIGNEIGQTAYLIGRLDWQWKGFGSSKSDDPESNTLT